MVSGGRPAAEYETDGPGELHWRDPWLVWDEPSGASICWSALAPGTVLRRSGLIGHAWSRDLRSWEAGPPLSQPGEFSQLEVPQLVHFGVAWRMLFCATQDDHGAARLGRAGIVPECGTHFLTGHEGSGATR